MPILCLSLRFEAMTCLLYRYLFRYESYFTGINFFSKIHKGTAKVAFLTKLKMEIALLLRNLRESSQYAMKNASVLLRPVNIVRLLTIISY